VLSGVSWRPVLLQCQSSALTQMAISGI
jgi:hypothetical protein